MVIYIYIYLLRLIYLRIIKQKKYNYLPLLHQKAQAQKLYVDLLLALANAMVKYNNHVVQKQDVAANVSSRQKSSSIQEEKLIQLLGHLILLYTLAMPRGITNLKYEKKN